MKVSITMALLMIPAVTAVAPTDAGREGERKGGGDYTKTALLKNYKPYGCPFLCGVKSCRLLFNLQPVPSSPCP